MIPKGIMTEQKYKKSGYDYEFRILRFVFLLHRFVDHTIVGQIRMGFRHFSAVLVEISAVLVEFSTVLVEFFAVLVEFFARRAQNYAISTKTKQWAYFS